MQYGGERGDFPRSNVAPAALSDRA